MKRPLLIIGILLLLGAVVNVAVAWGCALAVTDYQRARWLRPDRVNPQVSPADLTVFYAMGSEFVLPLGMGGHHPFQSPERVDRTHWDWSVLRKGGPEEPNVFIFAEEARGWPFRCLRCYWERGEIRGGVDLGGGRRAYQLEGGVRVSLDFPNARILPLIPIWPGFATCCCLPRTA